jgi:muconolactone delta-isomerase
VGDQVKAAALRFDTEATVVAPNAKGKVSISMTRAQMFMVVATMRDDVDPGEVAALRAAEHQQLQVLHEEGKVGTHHLCLPRRTAFLEVIAPDLEDASRTLATLPFAKFFEVDMYPLGNPAPTAGEGAGA